MRALGLPWTALGCLLIVACGDKSETTTDPGASVPGTDDTGGASADPTTAEPPGVTETGAPVTGETGVGSNSASNSDPEPASSDGGAPASSDDGGFIVEMDGGPDVSECDPLAQDCPDGEKCSAVSPAPGEPWGINQCVPLTGDGQPGDPCDIQDGKYTGLDDCGLGLICLLTDDEGKGGACVEFCDAQMQCPLTDANCVVYNDGSLPICLVSCDPLIQDCPEGQACYNSAGDNFVCFKESAMPGEGLPGAECQYINQCQQGSFCAAAASVADCPPESNGCCTPYCPVSGGPEPCQPTEECVAFFEMGMAPPGYEDVGVCAIPG